MTALCSEQCRLTFFKQTNGEIAVNAGILRQELIERIAAFKIVKQNFHWHARATETGSAAKNFRIDFDAGGIRHDVSDTLR